jgi:hypothetical protein
MKCPFEEMAAENISIQIALNAKRSAATKPILYKAKPTERKKYVWES